MNDPAEWEAVHQSRMWGTYPDIHVVRQVKKFLAGRHYPPIALDIGCGVGANSVMMGNEGIGVVAMDGSPTAIDRVPTHEYIFETRVADIQTVEFFPGQFDFILDNFTLTYIEHPPWERIVSWLKPGGWLVHASFITGPQDSPPTWNHIAPGEEVERHEIWNEHGTHSFAVRRYIKPS